MSESGRKNLVWYIRRSLLTLSTEELSQIVRDLGPISGQNRAALKEGDHEACFDYISSFIYSKHCVSQRMVR